MNRNRRVLSAFEITLVCASYLFSLWCLGPNVQALWARVAFYVLVAAGALHILWISPFVLHKDTQEKRGRAGSYRTRTRAWLRPYGALTLAGAIVLIAIALVRDPHVFQRVVWRSVVVRFATYIPSAIIQAVFVFSFLMTRIRDVLDHAPALGAPVSVARRFSVVLATASLFTALHVPNTPLMAFAFVAGLGWAWLFYTRPSVLLLALSHATLGTILHRFVELHTKIGPFFGHPEMRFTRILIPGAKELIGNLY